MFREVLHHLLRVAEATETKLRQSHRDLAKSAFLKHGRYMKAKQFRRAARERTGRSRPSWEAASRNAPWKAQVPGAAFERLALAFPGP